MRLLVLLLLFAAPFFIEAQDADAVKPKSEPSASLPADEVVLEPTPSDEAAKEREEKRREERKKEREEERKKKQKRSGKGKCKV